MDGKMRLCLKMGHQGYNWLFLTTVAFIERLTTVKGNQNHKPSESWSQNYTEIQSEN